MTALASKALNMLRLSLVACIRCTVIWLVPKAKARTTELHSNTQMVPSTAMLHSREMSLVCGWPVRSDIWVEASVQISVGSNWIRRTMAIMR